MNKEMIISSSDHETRVAILEDDQVVEVFIERERQRGVVGNIYKGRVSKVLPGMQSSFVDIGLERDAFLYVTEVVNTVEEFERLEPATTRTTTTSRPRAASRSPSPARRRREAPTAPARTAASNAAPRRDGRRPRTAIGTAIANGRRPRSKTC